VGERNSWRCVPPSAAEKCILLNGKNFCLGGGGGGKKEHRDLKLSQFARNKEHWKYVENGSKALHGGVPNLCRENKVVRKYPCPAVGRACHVYLLDLYFSELPEGAKEKDVFYFSAVRKTPTNPSQPWFTNIPIGWNKLDRFVRDV